jgi:hypothetical protein
VRLGAAAKATCGFSGSRPWDRVKTLVQVVLLLLAMAPGLVRELDIVVVVGWLGFTGEGRCFGAAF